MNIEFVDAATQPGARTDGPINIAQYWSVILKHRRLIGLIIALACIVGIVSSLLTRPTYRASAVLDIEAEKSSPVDVTTAPPASAYDPEFLPTQARLMTSREVAERVVQRLNLTANEDFLPKKTGFFASAKPSTETSKIDAARLAAVVQSGIAVSPIRGTNLVELSFTSTSPKLASDVANAVADAYIDWNLESKFQVLGQASQFLTAQIEQLKSEIDDKERQLQAYSRQKDIVSVDPQNVTAQRLESLNRDYADAVADRVAKEAKYHEVSTARPDAIADTLSNGFVSQLRNEQAKLEREYADKLNLYKPEWPAMQQLKAQIDKGRQHLDSVIQETVAKARDVAKGDYETALRREESLKAVLQGQKTEAMTLNTNAVEYNNLRVEIETKRALMDTLLKRNAETQISSRLRGERLSNIRVVDRALPPHTRFRPSYRMNALMSIFFGSAIGVALAFLLEYLDRSLRSIEEVEHILELPALGVIAAVGSPIRQRGYGYGKRVSGDPQKTSIELLPHDQPRSTISEAYRSFRTALLLSRAGGLQKLAVTSSMPAEGKTSTALNLAVVLGQLAKRVLVVDADLHKPRLHEIFRVSNRIGLVSILAENVSPTEAIHKTAVPNVFLVTAGPTSPNPSGLLASAAMIKFVEFVGQNFDYVIFDTPPVSPVADALIIGNCVDGVVLTVRGGRTPREQVIRTRDKLLRSNVKILGVLINNLEEQSMVYGRYYRYYGGSYAEDKPYAETPRVASSR